MVPETRRFFFQATATAFGGRIVRPRSVVLLSDACSSVGVSGGRAESRVKARRFKPFVSIDGAATTADARFDDAKLAKALSEGDGHEEELVSSSLAKAMVEGITVGSKKRLTVVQLGAALRGQGRPGHDEPSVIISGGTAARGVLIDGHPLTVELDLERFGELATYSEFVRAGSPGCLTDDRPAPGGPARPVLTTIVKSLRWTRREPPTARIEGHTVKVDDFGRIFFGEMLITGQARRLTMMRVRLGSPEGGSADFAEVQTNGSWYPPIL
jgi:hypothetical protein